MNRMISDWLACAECDEIVHVDELEDLGEGLICGSCAEGIEDERAEAEARDEV